MLSRKVLRYIEGNRRTPSVRAYVEEKDVVEARKLLSLRFYGCWASFSRFHRQTLESRARKIESKLIAKAEQNGPSVILRRAPLLSAFRQRFLDWVNHGRGLADNSRRYYRLGWQRVQNTPLMGMTLDRINAEEVDQLQLSGSPSYVNQALRTLRRVLGKAVEWKVLMVAPKIALAEELERRQALDPESERLLLAVGKQPLNDV